MRADGLEMVDEPRQRLRNEPLPRRARIDHQLVRARQRERPLHRLRGPARGGTRRSRLLPRLRDGAVCVRGRCGPVGELQQAGEAVVHARKLTAAPRKK